MSSANKSSRPPSSSFWIFFTLVQIHNFMHTAAVDFNGGNETDREALLDFKARIQADPFQALSSWNDATHFCDWNGVSCGKLHQRVTILNVSGFGLHGSLSPSVGNLSFLREIYVQENNFGGVIPDEIGRLFRLQNLVLANNSFEGELPANLTNCSELRVMDSSGNSLRGRIPDGLSRLSKLYDLRLSRNNFSGRIPPSLGNLSSLETLGLMRNNLTGNIPAEIGRLSNLRTLQISSNKLSGTVPPELYNLSSLQILSITNNLLTGEFPATMGLTLPNLVWIAADLNQFYGSIPASLANASGLLKITMGDNALSGPIPLNLGSLKQLQVLHFGHNPLGTNKANDISFISSLTNCTNLEILSLSRIQIGGVLPADAIANLSAKLTSLWLNDNIISGSLPAGIENLVNLNYIDVRNNSLTGSIPDSVGKLANLNKLHLSENSFSGEIPSSLGNITGLQLLTLDQNMLTGSLPVSLSNCSDLEGLTVSQNRLSGSLPEQVSSLSSLSLYLFLDHNQFTGKLPSTVGNLSNLAALDVSENKLAGEIPISLGSCEMLEFLGLEGNFLEGSIPASLGQLKNIEFIDLSRNNLSGQIPASLAKLKFIRTLNLSYNMLEGEIPEDGVFMNSSVFSATGNQKLCGGIKALNLSSCPKPNKNKVKLSATTVVAVAVSIPLAIAVLLAAATYSVRRMRTTKQPPSSAHEDEQKERVSYRDLFDWTSGFSSGNLIGEGRYGSVYKGVLKNDEKMVAIKVFKLHQHGGVKSFLAECEALRNIRHRNLVKIITTCSSVDFYDKDFKALIFEYAPNGSLDNWLYDPSSAQEEKKLNVLDRLNIAIDIASALDYLHHHSGTPIVHCDLKPSNILLGDDLLALVTDFGQAKFLSVAADKSHENQSMSTAIRGTVGYVAPEYGMGGEISAKGDVYAYGILLLEMFTGKRPTDDMFTEDFGLHSYVKMALPHRVMEIVDPKILEEEETKTSNMRSKSCSMGTDNLYLLIFQIAVWCSKEMQRDRMNIKDALCRLQAIRNDLGRIMN